MRALEPAAQGLAKQASRAWTDTKTADMIGLAGVDFMQRKRKMDPTSPFLLFVAALVATIGVLCSVAGTVHLWVRAGRGERVGLVMLWLLAPFIMAPFTCIVGIQRFLPTPSAE